MYVVSKETGQAFIMGSESSYEVYENNIINTYGIEGHYSKGTENWINRFNTGLFEN